MAIQVHTSMARAIQPFSTASDGDTLYAASTQEVDGKEMSPDGLATVGGEAMWDAVLASVPIQNATVLPVTHPTITADMLAAYAGLYEFAGAPTQAIGPISGLGLETRVEDGLPRVVPVAGGPAAAAGVLAGDIVTELDGASLRGVALDQVIGRMRGPTGSTVNLTVARGGKDTQIQIPVVRGPVRVRSLLQVQAKDGGLTVEAVGGRQVYEFSGNKPVAVTPLSSVEFVVDGRYHTRIAFTGDAAGNVSGAVLNPGSWEQKGEKVG